MQREGLGREKACEGHGLGRWFGPVRCVWGGRWVAGRGWVFGGDWLGKGKRWGEMHWAGDGLGREKGLGEEWLVWEKCLGREMGWRRGISLAEICIWGGSWAREGRWIWAWDGLG